MHDALYNIGSYTLDEELITLFQSSQQPQLIVQPERITSIVLGRSSKIDKELNVEACLEDNITLLRRKGGGCSVVLDPGNVIVAACIPAYGLGDISKHFTTMTNWLIHGIQALGNVTLYKDGISDLVVDNKKIAGTSMYRSKGLLYFSASILFKADLSLIEKYLCHPPREPTYRNHRSHKDFVQNLHDYLPLSTPDFCRQLQAILTIPSLH